MGLKILWLVPDKKRLILPANGGDGMRMNSDALS
jgi:hypothetical protein